MKRQVEAKDEFGVSNRGEGGKQREGAGPRALPAAPHAHAGGDGDGDGAHGNGMSSVSSAEKDQLAGALPRMTKQRAGASGGSLPPVPQLPLSPPSLRVQHKKQRRAAAAEDGAVDPSDVSLVDEGGGAATKGGRGGKSGDQKKSGKGVVNYYGHKPTRKELVAHIFTDPFNETTTYMSPLFEQSDVARLYKDEENKMDGDDYLEVLTTIKAITKHRLHHMGKFIALFVFTLFVFFYCTVVYLQTSPSLSYLVGSSVDGLLKPGESSTQDPNYFYSWLNDQVLEPVWTEVVCGDGRCQPPYEIPAFGRFGCKADCGVAGSLVTLVLQVTSKFAHPVVSPFELMVQARWNLCLTVGLCTS